jgi:glycosyltransferase involved in cell wall biosynthesis
MTNIVKNKCNIAFLAHGDRNVGGGEQSWFYLVTKIDRTRFAPIVIYSKRNRFIDQLAKGQVPVVRLPLSPKITGLYRDQAKFDPLSLIIYSFYLAQGVWTLTRLLYKNQIHILHAHDNLSKIIGIPASKLLRIKIITNCNDQLGDAAIDRVLLFLQRKFMDKVFCVTNYIGLRFRKDGVLPPNVAIVYSAIEPKHWDISVATKPESGSQHIKIGIVAVFDRVKGHQYLFEAVKCLAERGERDFSCLVIGDGREKERIHELVAQLGLDELVDLRGYVSDLIGAFRELDILVIPSLQESFGMVAVEAMAMGIPVVASRVGGLPEVIQDGVTGVLVPPANPRKLADAIGNLMDNPEVRFQMGQSGRARVREHFDIDKNLKISEEIIWELYEPGNQIQDGV